MSSIKDYISYTDCTNFETDWTISRGAGGGSPLTPHIYAPDCSRYFICMCIFSNCFYKISNADLLLYIISVVTDKNEIVCLCRL